ncbi:DNA cytosine methyltransferase [Anaerophaga thermohalophila]|jgi:DNA (cytosine-5)-methyltransferase 1|uniref:DNA cytosine methyltransferase n=1 Tax=Anaerophaga thermohalophila TaxID=177400 RepID=UPI0003105901|nr:DNA (cytosine-5-)-methyltransferase [Anaerophaga thermohalophila]
MNFIDLFSGAGGLSEGFIRSGFKPIAHVEIDRAACNTLITRAAYHYLKKTDNIKPYLDYIQNKITRTEFYSLIPDNEKESVINLPIGDENNKIIFDKIDSLRGNESIDFIIGGPPCQAYSVVGRSRDENRMHGDSRNYLFKEYAKFLEYYQPKYFVFENVVGLLSAKTKEGDSYLQMMLNLFEEKGYFTEYKILEAKNFGVLQNRKRVILIGKKNGKKGFYPDFEKIEPNVTVSEIFKDLPEIVAGSGNFYTTRYKPYNGSYLFESRIRNGLDFTTQHIARPHTEQDKGIYKLAVKKWENGHQRLNYNDIPAKWQTHKNKKAFVDRFKVVAGDLPYSQTIVAHICKDGHYYIHPDIKQNRSLTPREAARLQTFPDDFYFEGASEKPSRTAAFKQIGNAVPPLMAEAIANKLKEKILND